MTKVLVVDTKTDKERVVSRREAAVFAKLLPRGRYLTRDMVAQRSGAPLAPRIQPAEAAQPEELQVDAPAAPGPEAAAQVEPAKKKPGRPKKTDQQ